MSDARDQTSALDDSLPPKELLSYYKNRIDDFDTEREELLKKIDALAVDQTELHRLEWENKQRSGEIWELQKALSCANDALFRERERLLKLQGENDDAKLRDDENRKKIQYLLSLTQTGEQEITYLRNSKPETMEIRPREGRRVVQGDRMLRTVYLPTANADSLILKVESLQAQLNEQRQYCAERVEALLRDKRADEEKMCRHRLNYEQQIEMAAHKIQRLEEMLRNCTRDYIIARRSRQENEERAVAAESALEATKTELTAKIAQLKDSAATQLQKIQRSTQATIESYVEKFQEQVQEKQSDLLALEKTFGASQEQYEGRIADLEQRLSKLAAVNKQLETRRAHDREGFVNETSLLRKKLTVIERRLHQMRLIERLSDDDRLDRMLQEIENQMPDFANEDGKSFVKLCSSSSALAEEIQKIESSLVDIEHRIRHQRRQP